MLIVQFRQISQQVLDSAEASCAQLIYSWTLAYKLSSIKDRLSVYTQGYLFVIEPSNSLSDKYLELSRRACLATVDGLITDKSQDYIAVGRYLDLVNEFLRHILVLAYLTSGQAPRGTELLSIEHYNTLAISRGVCIYSGKIILISRHTKSRRTTNKEFLVVRFLPARLSALIFFYLVYIRPFVYMLNRICFNWHQEELLLFASL